MKKKEEQRLKLFSTFHMLLLDSIDFTLLCPALECMETNRIYLIASLAIRLPGFILAGPCSRGAGGICDCVCGIKYRNAIDTETKACGKRGWPITDDDDEMIASDVEKFEIFPKHNPDHSNFVFFGNDAS